MDGDVRYRRGVSYRGSLWYRGVSRWGSLPGRVSAW